MRDRKVEAAEESPVEETASEPLAAPTTAVPEVIVAEELPESRGQAVGSNYEGERRGSRSENMPTLQRDPRREDPRRDQRPHDRGPRPNRHERSDRPDRWDRPPPPRPERMPLDLRELSDKAWLLFSAELREEGVTFVDDVDAEKLTNRCFKLAEIFVRHRQRRLSQGSGGAFPEDRRRDEGRGQPSRPPQREYSQDDRPTDETDELPNEEDGD